MNRNILALMAFLAVGLLNSLSYATDPVTYYLRLDGSDANSGLANTSAGAWKTLAKVNRTTLNAGDVVHLGTGVFGSSQNDTTLVVPSSGTAALPIVFEGEGASLTTITAEAPVSIWGTGTGWEPFGAVAKTYYHLIAKDDSIYAMWKGTTGVNDSLLTRVMTATPTTHQRFCVRTAAGAGIDTVIVFFNAAVDTTDLSRSNSWAIFCSKNYITLTGMKVTHGGLSNYGTIYNSGTNGDVHAVVVDSSRGSGIYMAGATADVYNTTVSNNGSDGLLLTGDSSRAYNNTSRYNGSHGITITGNTSSLYNNTSHNNSNYGIYASGASVSIYNNTVYNNSSLAIDSRGASANIHNNVVYSGGSYGLYVRGTLSTVYNNTVYKNGETQIVLTSTDGGYKVKNNIIVSTTPAFLVIPSSAVTPNEINNNLYYTTGAYTGKWSNGTAYNTLAAWQVATSLEANSLTGDPLFVNETAGNYRLKTTSPAKNRGDDLALSRSVTDIRGKLPNGLRDMGAYEYWRRNPMSEISGIVSSALNTSVEP